MALESITMVNQKRDGSLKCRACADGRKQRDYIPREDAASPTTVHLDSIFIASVIDAAEHRDTAVVDLPGEFLSADNPDLVHMVFRGKMAELMGMTDPKTYQKFITYDSKGQALLYVELTKMLYGMLKSALLFYLKLWRDLRRRGFVRIDYDPCVTNKMVNGNQMTVI